MKLLMVLALAIVGCSPRANGWPTVQNVHDCAGEVIYYPSENAWACE